MILLARIVRLATKVAAGAIVVGILLYVLDANRSSEVVSAVLDAGRWLVGPFDNLFSLSRPKVEIAVNWGIAAALWLAVGTLIARLLLSASTVGRRRVA
jgi:hypothetical protein